MTRKLLIALFVILLSSCEKTQDSNEPILKFYGDAYEDIGYSVAKTDDGYIIAGQLTKITRLTANHIDSSEKKIGIIRTSSDGNVIWKQFLGDSTGVASKVITLSDGSIVCSGFVNTKSWGQDVYVVKLDGSGNVIKQKIYSMSGNQYGTDLLKTADGFLILATTDAASLGSTEATGNAAGNKDILLLRTDENFELIKDFQKGFPGNDEATTIKEAVGGGYIIAGTTDLSQNEKEQGGKNILLYRVNTDCSPISCKILGGLKNESAADIEVLDDGYLVAGTIGIEGSDQQGYVWRLSTNIMAEPLSQHEIIIEPSSLTKPSFSLKAICRYKTSSFLMAGQYGKGSTARMLIFAADADGNLIEGDLKVAGGTGTQVANDILSDSEYVVTVGKNTYENNSMISLLKFRF